MAQDLVTRLLLDSNQFEKNIYGAKRRLNELRLTSNTTSSSLKDLQKFLGAIGGAVLTKSIADSVRELNKLQTALLNVSGSVVQFNQNMDYIKIVAEKYGASISTLIGLYTKFIAAGNTTSMSLDQQKKIFESIVQASTAMGLSTDEMQGALLAVTQMMSKGTVLAEELRGQLGERIPGAFGLAAKAMGVTESALSKMLQLGQVAAKDLLPKLAEQLNLNFSSFDPNSLEGSLNKIKNMFTEIWSSPSILEGARKMMNVIVKTIEFGFDNIKTIAFSAIGAVGGLLTQLFQHRFQASFHYYEAQAEKLKGIFASLEGSIKSNLNLPKVDLEQAFGLNAETIRKNFELAGEALPKDWVHPVLIKLNSDALNTDFLNGDADEIIAKRIQLLSTLKEEYAGQMDIERALLRLIDDLKRYSEGLDEVREKNPRIVEQINQMANTNSKLKKGFLTVIASVKRLGAALWDIAKANAVMLIATAIGAAIGYFSKLYEQAHKVRKAIKEIGKEVAGVEHQFKIGGGGYEKELAIANALKQIIVDTNKSLDDRRKAYVQLTGYAGNINTITESMLTNENAINKAIALRIQKRRDEAILQAKASAYAKLHEEKNEISKELANDGKLQYYKEKGTNAYNEYLKTGNQSSYQAYVQWLDKYKERVESLSKDIPRLNKAMKEYESAMIEIERRNIQTGYSTTSNEGLAKVVDDYNAKVGELNRQKARGVLSNDEYSESLRQLKENAAKSAAAIMGEDQAVKAFILTLGSFRKVVQPDKVDVIGEAAEFHKWQSFGNDLTDDEEEVPVLIIPTLDAAGQAKYDEWKRRMEEDGIIIPFNVAVGLAEEPVIPVVDNDDKANTLDYLQTAATLMSALSNNTLEGASAWLTYSANVISGVMAMLPALASLFGIESALGIAKQAKMGFPMNLIAMTATATALAATIANLPKFESGGIVGGNSFYGDNVIARVNSGEMILNNGQLANLFKLLQNGGSSNSLSEVQFRISGSDLVGTINNYGKKKGKVL